MIGSLKKYSYVCCLLLASCASLQKKINIRQQELNSDVNAKQILQQQLSGWQTINWQDSAVYVYGVEIWPKGKFSFSPDSGFVGEAEKIKWVGGNGHQLSMRLKHHIDINKTNLTAYRQKQHAQLTVKDKDVNRQPFIPATSYLLFFILLVAAVFLLYKYGILGKR